MAHLINKREVTENGVVYIVEEYSSGAIVKYNKPTSVQPEPEIQHLTDIEESILETALNTEYLVCLAELGL